MQAMEMVAKTRKMKPTDTFGMNTDVSETTIKSLPFNTASALDFA